MDMSQNTLYLCFFLHWLQKKKDMNTKYLIIIKEQGDEQYFQ